MTMVGKKNQQQCTDACNKLTKLPIKHKILYRRNNNVLFTHDKF